MNLLPEVKSDPALPHVQEPLVELCARF